MQLALNLSDSYKDGNVWYGRIGSGDIWNREVDRIMYLNKEYNTLCEDMGVLVFILLVISLIFRLYL